MVRIGRRYFSPARTLAIYALSLSICVSSLTLAGAGMVAAPTQHGAANSAVHGSLPDADITGTCRPGATSVEAFKASLAGSERGLVRRIPSGLHHVIGATFLSM